MKILKIILFLSLFSIMSFVQAKEGYVENLLEFGQWPEAFDINIVSIEPLTFADSGLQKKYDDFVKTADTLKTAFIWEYANGKFDYYKMQAIINNYNNFVYHTNKFFFYLNEKEKHPSLKELTRAISKNYKLSRSYFQNIKNLYNN